MRIGIDARLWNQTGVGRYIRNLVNGIGEIEQKKESGNKYVIFLQKKEFDEVSFKSSSLEKCLADIPWHTISEQLRFPKLLNRQNLDLVHFPYFSVPVFYKKPSVITIHDLILNDYSTGRASTLPYPIYQIKKIGYNFVISQAVSNAIKIIVPSRAVESDLNRHFQSIKDKIMVTYEGVFETLPFDKKANSSLLPNKPYFLRVGNMYPHKNVEMLINSFTLFIHDKKNENILLLLAGKNDFFRTRIERSIPEEVKDKILFIDNPTDASLLELYKNSLGVIVPSLIEGFSLTALEALSQGAVVLASDIPVHREICGKAAIFADPKNVLDILEKMNIIVDMDKRTRASYRELGLKKVKEFSWERMVSQTIKIYESCIGI